MGMTSTEKILARAAGLDEVHAGQLIMAKLDLVLGNDITSPVAIGEFEKFGRHCLFNALYIGNAIPNRDDVANIIRTYFLTIVFDFFFDQRTDLLRSQLFHKTSFQILLKHSDAFTLFSIR